MRPPSVRIGACPTRTRYRRSSFGSCGRSPEARAFGLCSGLPCPIAGARKPGLARSRRDTWLQIQATRYRKGFGSCACWIRLRCKSRQANGLLVRDGFGFLFVLSFSFCFSGLALQLRTSTAGRCLSVSLCSDPVVESNLWVVLVDYWGPVKQVPRLVHDE